MSKEIELLEKQLAFWKHHCTSLTEELTKEEEIANRYSRLLDETEEELNAERIKNEANRKQSEWISVEERLPESEKIVLVSAVSKTFHYRHTLMVAHIGHHEFTTEDIDWREYEGDTEYDEENDCFWIPECWYEVNSVEDNGNWIIDSDYDVTHWMPLPEAPKMKGGAE